MSNTARKLGKLPPRRDLRNLKFARYVDLTKLPAPPSERDWTKKALLSPWGMMLNDQIGDCGEAGKAHLIQVQTAANDNEITISDEEILKAYQRNSGYVPGDESTDNGEVLIDSLKDWATNGIGGHKIGAFAEVDHTNRLLVEAAINLGGGVYVGAALPLAAQNQTVWDVAPPGSHDSTFAPNSWGGHCMALVAYGRTHVVFVTWGGLKVATWEWFLTYVDECYFVLDDDWVTEKKPAPNGFDLAALKADLAIVRGGVIDGKFDAST